jgi:hypothetical protein
MMQNSVITILRLWLILACLTASAFSQDAVRDPRIVSALEKVSAARIQANVEKLVSFHTRLTTSAQDSVSIAAGRGIGAAREWIKSEFESYSRDCGGCLEVKTDRFIEGKSDRIPQPTQIRLDPIYAAVTTFHSTSKGMPPYASPSFARTIAVSTRTCALKMASNMATCRSLWILITSLAWHG